MRATVVGRVEQDPHLDHAGIGIGRRVHVQHVVLEDHLADALDLSGQRLGQRRAGDRGRLADSRTRMMSVS